ncbi:uncharacterized protein BDZ99DRAFT_520053 [Mytilinidion resinicola]|uniref:Uncharacterized protein n=1 Tax=Mytilinidion resinicola TaxID=574789 RepID=A0A6A6YM59_9PEZI|nr:uncharacterized protein BDZ99DRAFT_520053 [Mytilinidion resinicola]KAF2809962.1 hypothetical protein BDZ99DRAFT_520053 [Mytilinidion resinicola]
MAHHDRGGRSYGAYDTPIAMKGAIIALRLLSKLQYQEIERQTGVSESTAAKLYNKAKQDAGNEDLHDMLASLCPRSARPGMKPKVPKDTALSHQIRQDILLFEDYPFEEAAAPAIAAAGLKPLARSTIENIAWEHRDPLCPVPIVRGIRPKKPALDAAQKDTRFKHCSWIQDTINRT